jgi:hypothetical protein
MRTGILGSCLLMAVMTCGVGHPAAAEVAPDGGRPIREIPVPGLPSGGLSAYDQWGPVIYIDPQLIALGGAVFEFLRLHEYGHHRRGHVTPRMAYMFATNPYARAWITKPMELDADCYAASQLARRSRSAAEEAARYFERAQGPFSGAPFYPSGFERAAYIRHCASSAPGSSLSR